MFLLRKALVGSLLILFTYLFWSGYILVLQNDLFFFYPWLDNIFHITGGIILGLVYYSFALYTGRDITKRAEAIRLVMFVLIIGLYWEVFEMIFGFNKGESHLFWPTMKDLANDVIGALLVLGLGFLISCPLARRFGLEKQIKSKQKQK